MHYILEALLVGIYTATISTVLLFSNIDIHVHIPKSYNLFLFIVGFLKHFLAYYLNIHNYYCHIPPNKTAPISNLVLESLMEGFSFIVIGYLMSFYLVPYLASSFFVIGFTLHIIAELTGVHAWFCGRNQRRR